MNGALAVPALPQDVNLLILLFTHAAEQRVLKCVQNGERIGSLMHGAPRTGCYMAWIESIGVHKFEELHELKRGANGKANYAYSDAERDETIAQLGGKPTIQRFKGLGEMMPAELAATTMDPATRLLKRVTCEDAVAADRVFSTLMGSNIAPRKQFITEHAKTLDLSKIDL